MSDTSQDGPEPIPTQPAAAPPPPDAALPKEAPRRRGILLPLITLLLLLALLGAVGELWQRQEQLAGQLAAAADPGRVAALEGRVQSLADQLAAQAKAPAAAPAPAVDLAPLEQRLAALEQQKPPPAPDVGPLVQKLDSVAAEARSAQDSARSADAEMASRLVELGKRLQTAEQQAGRATQVQAVARAQVALDNGVPLGDIDGAPKPLARFAHDPPPTEAALRLGFPSAAAAAERASRPGTFGKSLAERMWLRARALVTVKQGDTVLVGSPAAEVLGGAQARLDAGDLRGAVAALDGLDGPAAQAMAAWRGQAQALLDARAALSQMARG